MEVAQSKIKTCEYPNCGKRTETPYDIVCKEHEDLAIFITKLIEDHAKLEREMEVAKSKISPQWHTRIPKAVQPWLKAEVGDFLVWSVENGRIEVRKK